MLNSRPFHSSMPIVRQWLVMSVFMLVFSGLPSLSYAAEAYIVGIVFLDVNENGLHDPDEPLRTGQGIYLDDLTLINQGSGGSFYTTTNNNGEFQFTVQSIGAYEISTDLEDMQLTAPVFADGFMDPYTINVTKAEEVVRVDFGLSGATADLFIKNREDSMVIYNQQYGLRASPKAEGFDATSVTAMQAQQLDVETFTGDNNTAAVFLSPNTSTPTTGTRSLRSQDDFTLLVGQNVSPSGEEALVDVRPNADGSLTLVDPRHPTVTATLHTDGHYTFMDSAFPTHVVTTDNNGNLIVSDTEHPDAQLLLTPEGQQTVTDKEFPGVALELNDDDTYTITDEEFPEFVTTYNPADDSYIITDTVENITVFIDTHGNYTAIDNASGTCIAIPNLRFWKALKKFFNKIAKFIAKIASFIKKIAKFIKKALPIVIKVLRVVSTIAAVVAPIFPPLCAALCAISAFATQVADFLHDNSPAINEFLDKTIDIAGKVEKGANTVAAWTEPDTKKSSKRRSQTRTPVANLREGQNCASPPGIVMDYTVGAAHESHNAIDWATVAEFDNQGFNIWRGTEKNATGDISDLMQINTALIPALPDAQWGTTYRFIDDTIAPNQTYYYMIESVATDGVTTQQLEFVAEVKSVSVAAPTCLLYGVQDEAVNDSHFFVYDFQAETTEAVGQVCQGCDIEAMAVHPVTQDIYVASGDNAQGHPKGYLYKFNPTNGELIPVGATGFQGVTSLAFDENAVLWAWAEHEGLGQIDTESGQGQLLTPFTFKAGDLVWDADAAVLYAAVNKQLWRYTPATEQAELLCRSLPPKTEALTQLPPALASEGYLLLGSHLNGFELHAYDAANCDAVVSRDIAVPYDDVEGLAIADRACVNY